MARVCNGLLPHHRRPIFGQGHIVSVLSGLAFCLDGLVLDERPAYGFFVALFVFDQIVILGQNVLMDYFMLPWAQSLPGHKAHPRRQQRHHAAQRHEPAFVTSVWGNQAMALLFSKDQPAWHLQRKMTA